MRACAPKGFYLFSDVIDLFSGLTRASLSAAVIGLLRSSISAVNKLAPGKLSITLTVASNVFCRTATAELVCIGLGLHRELPSPKYTASRPNIGQSLTLKSHLLSMQYRGQIPSSLCSFIQPVQRRNASTSRFCAM